MIACVVCEHEGGQHLGPHPNGAAFGWTSWFCDDCHEPLGNGPTMPDPSVLLGGEEWQGWIEANGAR